MLTETTLNVSELKRTYLKEIQAMFDEPQADVLDNGFL